MKKLYKFWLGMNLTTTRYGHFKDADELRTYIKTQYPDVVGYGYQAVA